MKLSEALTRLKNIKSKLARVRGFITKSIVHYENETPEYNFVNELESYETLKKEILDLKTRIQLTNATTSAYLLGKKFTVSGLILLNAELRDSLSFYSELLNQTTEEDYTYLRSGKTKDSISKVFAKGFNKYNIRKEIEELEFKRETLEAVLANVNTQTELADL